MSRSRRNKKKVAKQKGMLITMFAFVIILAFGYIYWDISKNSIIRDSETMCRTDDYISKDTVLLIDATDSFSSSQSIQIEKEVKKILLNASIDDRFSLYVIDDNTDDFKEAFYVCNPGDGSNKSELTSNKRRLKENWEKTFYDRVINSVKELAGTHTSNTSPIIEMIKLASLQTLYSSNADSKEMIIISDMLEHTTKYSHYKNKPNFDEYKRLPYSIEQKPNLDGVDVKVFYLVRTKDRTRQNRGHINFWELLVMDNGGYISNVKVVN
ncbi:hypothetical protein BIT28_15550 [Photobacterium proteolyticum]|uniref:VWFA domain-containing protein n=1 Tax=Photobacterium proteolyticum TaxID=1903952 RepID=A0A1Q9G932_9GAMM|nr:hypothetical protein [Photobacterium proteolyticum]OLQ70825.1 hypothetical protein BIT28_15550 [Photobacterium proteolyticum]